MNKLIKDAAHIPVPKAQQAISISPITLPMSDRDQPLELRVTAPAVGKNLPIILLSHGHGPSLYLPSKDGYGPLVNFLAERGFVVIQPTHANSRVAGLDPKSADAPLFWRQRIAELTAILDGFTAIEAQAPILAGRLDRENIGAIGHSMGGQTVGMLLGARFSDLSNPDLQDVTLTDPRIKVGVLMAGPGNGGAGLSEFASRFGFFNAEFSQMKTKTLVIVGDADTSEHLTTRGAEWHCDPYHHGPGADALLTLKGGKHGMGGIAGYDAKETDDEDPDRLEITLRMTWAYLQSAMITGDRAWADACAALKEHAALKGDIATK
ncbi:MAG: dienelactone hydrolase [Cypionkella sp.]